MRIFSFQSASIRVWQRCAQSFFAAACAIFFCLCARPAAAQNAGDAHLQNALEAPRVQRYALQLARRAALHFLQNGKILAPPQDIPAPLKKRAGVIVTYEKSGENAPRGCRGTLQPQRENLAQEIIENAVAAASRDSRVKPLRLEELSQCRISLTIITQLRPINSLAQHDAQNCGIIAQRGEKIGLVLPYEGRDAATQWRWAKRKAGLRESDSAQMLEVFAVRFRE